MPGTPLRIISWNVNGLRACARKGFSDWLDGSGAEIVGVQEVRATRDQLPDAVAAPRGARYGFGSVPLSARLAPRSPPSRSSSVLRFRRGGSLLR